MENQRFAEMISKIAHELRSPLTSVKGFSATLLSRWDRFSDEQRYELIGTIHSDAERMSRIVSEVLDLARLESGRLELHKTSVELVRVVAKAIDNVGDLPGAERVESEVPSDLIVLADAERLQHVFFNLLENAVKFSEAGAVKVRGEMQDEDAVVSIADEGIGIQANRLQDIFAGPGPAGQSATPRGTGLGLYLTKQLIEAHEGTIEVESEPGSGSTFFVRLPAVRA